MARSIGAVMETSQLEDVLRRSPAPLRGEAPLSIAQTPLRILFVVSAHNSLSQRAYVALTELGHEIEVAVTGRLRPLMKQADRRIDWDFDGTDAVVRKIRAAEGHPGVLDTIEGGEFQLFGVHYETAMRGRPGEIIARRHGAICRATVDGA